MTATSTLKILYVGDMTPTSSSAMRMRSQQELGHQIRPITTASFLDHLSIWTRVRYKLKVPPEGRGENAAILGALDQECFDILWIDKGLTIRPGTLKAGREKHPNLVIAGYALDDMGSRHNQSRYFLQGLPFYDIYFTTKTYNVPELKALGVPRVEYIPNAYDPLLHRPVELTAEEQRTFNCDISFIGTYELDRAEQILHLCKAGHPVRIYGSAWDRFGQKGELPEPPRPPVLGEDFPRAICGTAINLGFLRKANRDLQTQRSVEIPACGGFMLAERTDEHLGLFEEDKEAAYFSSREELVDKVRYYLAHPQERQTIAQAARRRCIVGRYTYRERMEQMLEYVREML